MTTYAPEDLATLRFAATGLAVAVVRWPADAAEVERLRLADTPRLLLVEHDADFVPEPACCEDWVRLPATDDDVRARVRTLAERADRHATRPVLRGDGRVVFRGRWAALSKIEESFLSTLADAFEGLVTADELVAGTGEATMTINAVRVHVMRLRRRVAPLGLVVRTVHGRGYVLEAEAALGERRNG